MQPENMKVVNRIDEALDVSGITVKQFCESLRRWEQEEKKKLAAQEKYLMAKRLRVTKNRTSVLFYKNNPKEEKQPNALTRRAMAEVLGWQVAELFKVTR